MSSKYLKLLKILELSSIKIFNENDQLFRENAAFTALLLQGLVHSPNNRNYINQIDFLILYLFNLQNQIDGYFIEKHANYHKPSALVSSLVGIALIDSMSIVNEGKKKKILDSLNKISKFLIQQEISKGSYRKSFGFDFSILNANASIALFMILHYKITKDEFLLIKVNEFIESLPNYTLNDGALTYGIYGQKYFIPCIYYHALTLLHLIRIKNLVDSKKLVKNLNLYLKWIKTCYDSNGIKWKKSGFIFSTYLNQAYSFIWAINKMICLNEEIDLAKFLNKSIHQGFLFRCDRIPGIIKRINTSVLIGIKSSKSIKNKFINIFLLICYSLTLRFFVKAEPRIYQINPLFKYLGLNSSVSPPINNSLDYMTSIESYCYIATAYGLSTRKNLKL